jgi:riboflavin synthase
MFNGIIYNHGVIQSLVKKKKQCFVEISSNLKVGKNAIGSSIACNGVCLTLTKRTNKSLFFFLSAETLKRTSFNCIKVGVRVNLEKSLTYGQKISGHYIQGHVDARGKVKNLSKRNQAWNLQIEVPNRYRKYLLEKGSVAINGVSLTISKMFKNRICLTIIPHTLKLTNLVMLKNNDIVNVELDIFSKYIINMNS